MNWAFRLVGCLIALTVGAAPSLASERSDKAHAALRQIVSLEFDNLTLDQCAERLQALTKLDVIVHESLRPLLEVRDKKLLAEESLRLPPMENVPPAERQPAGFSCRLRQLPLGTGLRIFLEHYGLGYAIVGESLIIATAEKAREIQHTQPVNLACDRTPLTQVVEELKARHGIPLVLDAQAIKDPRLAVTLQVRDVPLEDAIHLLADQANVEAAPLGAGWYLTTSDKAGAWRARARDRARSAMTTLRPALLDGGLGIGAGDGTGLVGGLGGGGASALTALEAFEVPRALLQVAGPPPHVGQVPAQAVLAVPLSKAAQPRKSLAAETMKKLLEPFDFPNTDPMTLKDAIQVMEDRGFPRIVINQQAFKDENPEAADLYESQVRFPPGKGGLTRAKTLQLILRQVPSGNANYLVRPGYILVTTNDSMHANAQFVRGASFVQLPLHEALLELSELSGISIIIDLRVGDKAKTLVTARFPGETNVAQATRLLADMADLKAVRIENIMYVTSRSNASVFPEEAVTGGGKYTKKEAGP